jgi:hypothetical protein
VCTVKVTPSTKYCLNGIGAPSATHDRLVSGPPTRFGIVAAPTPSKLMRVPMSKSCAAALRGPSDLIKSPAAVETTSAPQPVVDAGTVVARDDFGCFVVATPQLLDDILHSTAVDDLERGSVSGAADVVRGTQSRKRRPSPRQRRTASRLLGQLGRTGVAPCFRTGRDEVAEESNAVPPVKAARACALVNVMLPPSLVTRTVSPMTSRTNRGRALVLIQVAATW